MSLILAMLLQGAVPGSAAWKERHQPDPPPLPACTVKAQGVARTMKELPVPVRAALQRFAAGARGMADVGAPYNSTDMIDDAAVSGTRFLRAYHIGARWIVWYEAGGIATMMRMLAIRPEPGTLAAYGVEPGSISGGNLCAATRAIVAGVRN